MVDALHEHQLSVRPLGMGLVLKGSAQFLNSDVPLQDVVISRAKRKKERKKKQQVVPFRPRCVHDRAREAERAYQTMP